MLKQLFLIIGLFVLTLILLASCSASPQPTQENARYGGATSFITFQTGGFDPSNTLNFWPSGLLCYEVLISEDWGRGPSGTGETPLSSNYTPLEFFTGQLAERWEQTDARTVIFYLRRGVHWMKKPPVSGREFNADDVIATFNRDRASPRHTLYNTKTTVTKVDAYTVRFEFETPSSGAAFIGYSNFQVVPYELVNADLTDWSNMNTTGAFYVSGYLPDTSITYTRNPDYWQKDPFLKTNRLPYLDSISAVVMPDQTSQVAAFKSGKIASLSMQKSQADNLLKTMPGLGYRKIPPNLSNIFHMRTDQEGPFKNEKVRQALSLAIDYRAIARDLYQDDVEMLTWPFMSTFGEIYTPIEELPSKLKELYEYHPDKAMALLKEAGFPQGFSTTINTLSQYTGWVASVAQYWEAIGVKVNVRILEPGSYWNQLVGHTYLNMSVSQWGNTSPAAAMSAYRGGAVYNYSVVNDSWINEIYDKVTGETDAFARNKMLRDFALYAIEKQYYIQIPAPNTYVLWQSWLKGYAGEVAVGGLNNWYGMWKFVWVEKHDN